jgi:hypothetical protein
MKDAICQEDSKWPLCYMSENDTSTGRSFSLLLDRGLKLPFGKAVLEFEVHSYASRAL